MTNPIPRQNTSPSGTKTSMVGASFVVERRPGRQHRDQEFSAELEPFMSAVGQGYWEGARNRLVLLSEQLEDANDPLNLSAQRSLVQVLQMTAEAAHEEDQRPWWSWMLSILSLGIPLLVDAVYKSDVEKLESEARALRARIIGGDDFNLESDAENGVMDLSGKGDISSHMNLYVRNPLLQSTTLLAEAFGGPYVAMSDAVATQHYSQSGTVQPADFEVSAGVLLVDTRTRKLVSQDSNGFYRLELEGRSIFSAADGELYFEPISGEEPELVSEDEREHALRIFVPTALVGARARSNGDPEARPNMRYAWQGFAGESIEIGWWGQCESSGMLGSMGVLPAAEGVVLYDDEHEAQVEMSASDISNMMVFLGRDNYFSTSPARVAGSVNRDAEQVDGDKPHRFHDFVLRQIKDGLPFNLEEHAYEEIWNYPIREASIEPDGSALRRSGGGRVQRYRMNVEKSRWSGHTYVYTIEYNARGQVVDSEWDLEASAALNGRDNSVPDRMKSYFATKQTRVAFDAKSTGGKEQNMWTDEAVRMVGDLYFASHANRLDGESRIYVVRSVDGQLLQMKQSEFDAHVRGRAQSLARQPSS